jgi:hypothetical protein
MPIVFDDGFFQIIHEDERHLLRVIRSAQRFKSIKDGQRSFQTAADAASSIDKQSTRLLIDLRCGPMRNDPEFEEATKDARRQLFEGFSRSAVLVKSAVGLLQVNRHAKEDQKTPFFCNQEDEALAYLLDK